MATVEFVEYQGEQIHAERTNAYIADGHGDEVLVRTNRYVTGDHTCGNRCEGVNCPSDPALASELMESLRAKYENNLCGRKTKGATSGEAGVAHYQLIISWPPDERVPPAERYEMAKELIQRTKLRDHANLLAAHDNRKHDHIHDSVSAFSIDGTRKLCMNKNQLYDLRREMDHICVEHGYSIVESPELWGDAKYKEWFDCVRDLDVVPIHPSIPYSHKKRKKEETRGEQYFYATNAERRRFEDLLAELSGPRKVTPENRGTRYYGLPHVYNPERPDKQLYVYALDKTGKRKSPLALDYGLQLLWAMQSLKEIEKVPDYPRKDSLVTRITWVRDNAARSLDLISALDIGTRDELEAHTKAVGGDISKYRQESARQEKVIATAQEEGDAAKLKRAEARRAHAEETLAQRKDEYRQLKQAAAVLESMDTGEHWEEFRQDLLERSTKKLRVTDRMEQMIRDNFADIGRLLGVSQEEIDRIIDKAKASTPEEIVEKWYVIRGTAKITYTRRTSGIDAIYEYIGDLYADRRALRSDYYHKCRDRCIRDDSSVITLFVGLVGTLISFATLIPRAKAQAAQEYEIERKIEEARRWAEYIRWYNQMMEEQFANAKTTLALHLALCDAEGQDRAWEEFAATCNDIQDCMADMAWKEIMYAAEHGKNVEVTSIRGFGREIAAVMEHRPPSLDDQVRGAEDRKNKTSTPKKAPTLER